MSTVSTAGPMLGLSLWETDGQVVRDVVGQAGGSRLEGWGQQAPASCGLPARQALVSLPARSPPWPTGQGGQSQAQIQPPLATKVLVWGPGVLRSCGGGSLGVMLCTVQAQDSVLRDHGGVVRVMAWPWWGSSSES